MSRTSVDRRARALRDERFGDVTSLARERHRGGRRRGLDARRCEVCRVEHAEAERTDRMPQPVALALPGSPWCSRHQGGR